MASLAMRSGGHEHYCQTAPANLPALDLTFDSPRVAKLLFRYRARNFPGTLDDAEQQRWLQHRREVLNPDKVQSFLMELNCDGQPA